VKHYVLRPEERPGYAVFACPETPFLKLVIFQTIRKCPCCGQLNPLEEKHGKSPNQDAARRRRD
jgi:hypothetical protein